MELLSQKSSLISQVGTAYSFQVVYQVILMLFIDVELANNPLVKRVIAVLDRNNDGNISFLEFVQGLNSLSAGASHDEKLRFAFQIYDINNDGYISNGELFTVLKMMVGNNLTDVQLQQLVDRTIIKADKDFDGKISFEEFCEVSVSSFNQISVKIINLRHPNSNRRHYYCILSTWWITLLFVHTLSTLVWSKNGLTE